MKKLIVFLFLLLALVSCQDPVQQVAGRYSYKISGRAVVEDTERVLADEIGTMEIVHVSKDSALLTFNGLTSPVYYTIATITDKSITLKPYERDIQVGVSDYHVTAQGQGEIYDQTIIIHMQYKSADVNADDLTLLCKKN